MKYTVQFVTTGISDRQLNVDLIKTLSSLQSCSQYCTMTLLWLHLMKLILVLIQVTQLHREYYNTLLLQCFHLLSGSQTNIWINHHSVQPSLLHNLISPTYVCLPSLLLFFRFMPLPLSDPLLSSTMLFSHKCRFLSLAFCIPLLPFTHLSVPFLNAPSPFPTSCLYFILLLYSFASQHGSFLAFLQCWTLDTETNWQPQTLLYIHKFTQYMDI